MVIEPRASSYPQPVDTAPHVAGSAAESTQEDRRAMEQHYRNSTGRMPSPLTRHGSDGELSPRSSPTGRNFTLLNHNPIPSIRSDLQQSRKQTNQTYMYKEGLILIGFGIGLKC